MAKTFREQLIAARDAHHSKNHPYIDLWANGRLTKAQMAVYVVQHYHFVSDYLNWMLYIAARSPHRDVKDFMLENFTEEEDPDNRHIDMLFDFAAGCGISKEQFLATPVLPNTEALKDWGWRQVMRSPGRSPSPACSLASNPNLRTSTDASSPPSRTIMAGLKTVVKSGSLLRIFKPTRCMGRAASPLSRNIVRLTRCGSRPRRRCNSQRSCAGAI